MDFSAESETRMPRRRRPLEVGDMERRRDATNIAPCQRATSSTNMRISDFRSTRRIDRVMWQRQAVKRLRVNKERACYCFSDVRRCPHPLLPVIVSCSGKQSRRVARVVVVVGEGGKRSAEDAPTLAPSTRIRAHTTGGCVRALREGACVPTVRAFRRTRERASGYDFR